MYSHALQPPSVDVEFSRVDIEGYGPFKDAVSYELASRGLIVLTGRNEDDMVRDCSIPLSSISLSSIPLSSIPCCCQC